MKDHAENGNVIMRYTSTAEMNTDNMTKALGKDMLTYHFQGLGLSSAVKSELSDDGEC